MDNEKLIQRQLDEYLRASREAYSKWRIYEHYLRIAKLANVLHEIDEQTEELRLQMPHAVIFNHQGNKLTLECAENDKTLDRLAALIKWSLPKLVEQINYGDNVYDYVLRTITLQPVGMLPKSCDAGYALFFDHALGGWHIYRFAKKQMRLANGNVILAIQEVTDTVQELGDDIPYRNPIDIKGILASTFTDLPHPAMYKVEAEFPLPYAETMYPLGKQLLTKEVMA